MLMNAGDDKRYICADTHGVGNPHKQYCRKAFALNHANTHRLLLAILLTLCPMGT